MGAVDGLVSVRLLTGPAEFSRYFTEMAEELATEATEDNGDDCDPKNRYVPEGMGRSFYLGVIATGNFIANLVRFGYNRDQIRHALYHVLSEAAQQHHNVPESDVR